VEVLKKKTAIGNTNTNPCDLQPMRAPDFAALHPPPKPSPPLTSDECELFTTCHHDCVVSKPREAAGTFASD
jgi:hypothetical protein